MTENHEKNDNHDDNFHDLLNGSDDDVRTLGNIYNGIANRYL